MKAIMLEANNISNKLANSNLSLFGYRERIQVERLLFLSIKLLLAKYGYNLTGFSNKHIAEIKDYALKHKLSASFINVIDDVNQLKIHIKNISSSNAYVRNNALLNANYNIEMAMRLLGDKLSKIITNIFNLYSAAID